MVNQKANAFLSLLLLTGVLATGFGVITPLQPPAKTAEALSGAKAPPSPKCEGQRVTHWDRFGDPLPPHALARLGTMRWRHAEVECVAYSPDGRILASGGRNATISLWETATGKQIQRWEKQSGFIQQLQFSPDGHYLASLASDETIGLWKVPSGQCVHILKGQKWLRDMAFSPDGKTLASASYDSEEAIRLWDTASGSSRRFVKAKRSMASVAFSPDGKTLAASGYDGIIRLWTIDPQGQQQPIELAEGQISVLLFSPNGKILATGGDEIHLWDTHTRKLSHRFHSRGGGSLSFSRDGRRLAAAPISWPNAVTVWDVATGKSILRLPSMHIRSAVLSPDGKLLATTDADRIVFWDLTTGKESNPFDGPPFRVVSLCISPDGATVATAGDTAFIWDVASTKALHELSPSGTVFFAPDGKVLAARGDYPSLELWDLRKHRRLHTYRWQAPPRFESLSAIALSPDGKTLAAAGRDLRIRLWDAATERLLRVLEGHTYSIESLAFSPNSTLLASSSFFHGRHLNFVERDDTVRLWDVATGQLKFAYAPSTNVPSIAFSPDGKMLAAANDDSLMDVKSGKTFRSLKGNKGFCTCVAFSPDSRWLAQGYWNGLVKLWEVASGQEVCRFCGHQGAIESLAFFPDGRRLASGSRDATVLIWDLTLGLGSARQSTETGPRSTFPNRTREP